MGRDAELAQLHAAWERSARSGRQLVFVSGEPGIGKTRLVAEFAAQLGAHDVGVLYGRAEEEALVPYQPLVESLHEPLRHGVEIPIETGELSALLPEAAGREGRSASAAGSAPGERLRLFEVVSLVLDAITAGRPLLLVLDDLQWAERPTIRLLLHLAARPVGAPQMIVATYRDTEEHPLSEALASLYRELRAERIALAGLDSVAVAALVGGDHSSEAIQGLCEQTGGNPFFIEQLLPGDRIGVTETVSRRVSALGAEARAVLDAAAVSGSQITRSRRQPAAAIRSGRRTSRSWPRPGPARCSPSKTQPCCCSARRPCSSVAGTRFSGEPSCSARGARRCSGRGSVATPVRHSRPPASSRTRPAGRI